MGAWWIGVSASVGVTTAFLLRTRAPAWMVAALLAAAGAGVGWGGVLLRPDASPVEIGLVVGGLAVLVPFHVRIVLGPLGRR